MCEHAYYYVERLYLMGQYDRIMKLFVENAPEALARFVLQQWRKQHGSNVPEIEVTSVTLLSEEFQSEELKGDGVFVIYGPGGPVLLYTNEYQTYLTPVMPIRSLEYLGRSKKKHYKLYGKLPV